MTADEIVEIKRMYAAGMLQREIAAQIGCRQSTISLILSGKSGPRKRYAKRPFIGAAAEGHKHCAMCGEPKPLDLFYRDSKKSDGRGTWCKLCMRAYYSTPEGKAWRKASRARPAVRAARIAYYKSDKRLASHLSKTFNLSLSVYKQKLITQNNACAICLVLFANIPSRAVHTDHDHATGAFRGVLCHNCNKGLGSFRDSPKFLLNAVRYLLDLEVS